MKYFLSDQVSYLIGALFLVAGLVCAFKPELMYQRDRLTEQQIARNRRIWKRGGIFFAVMGAAHLILDVLGTVGVIK
jgi:hypothetical protein